VENFDPGTNDKKAKGMFSPMGSFPVHQRLSFPGADGQRLSELMAHEQQAAERETNATLDVIDWRILASERC
jgi:hypothetical protein